MSDRVRACVRALPVAAGFAALLALSLPGVEIARADDGIAPPADKLFSLGNGPDKPSPPSACAPPDPAQAQAEQQRQAEIAARIEALMQEQGGGEWQVLNGQGYGYTTHRSPLSEVAAIREEAARARAAEQKGH